MPYCAGCHTVLFCIANREIALSEEKGEHEHRAFQGAAMKKSLFRIADILELGIAYAFCFSLCLMFDYVKTLEMTSDILTNFSETFAISDHDCYIVYISRGSFSLSIFMPEKDRSILQDTRWRYAI